LQPPDGPVELRTRVFCVALGIDESGLGGHCLAEQVGIEWHLSTVPRRLSGAPGLVLATNGNRPCANAN
jgi:hypothetical protein